MAEDLESSLWWKKRLKLIRDNSIYGLPTLEVSDKTYEYCRNDALDTYRYLVEYRPAKPVTATEIAIEMDKLENSWRNNNMEKDEIYLVRWNKGTQLNEGSITLLGRVLGLNEDHEYDTYCYNDGKSLVLRSNDISITAKVTQNLWHTEDFANLLKRLGAYAKMGQQHLGETAKKSIEEYNLKSRFNIRKVIFSGPCTIVFWADGTKTMVRVQGDDKLDREKGLAMAIAKRAYGDKGNYSNIFKRWLLGENWRKLERAAAKIAKLAKVDKASDEDLKKSKKKSTKKR